MLTVPALIAVTFPDAALTVATALLEELQVPPGSPLLVKVAVAPVHKGEAPLTVPALAFGFTVNFLKADTGLPQPVFTVYVILVVPAPTTVTTPDILLTVATDVLVLLQVPPAAPLLLYGVICPIQSGSEPLIVPADTFAITVMTKAQLLVQPVDGLV